jgi:hypothetical protein
MFLVAMLGCSSLLMGQSTAEEPRPQIIPGERKVGTKEVGPRAVALLQLGANGKASLVPIAIMVNGKFWDATAYKADPVPMALDSGTVYEVEKAGSSQGLFTVNSALHSNSSSIQNPWLGTGLWLPAGTEKPKTSMKAESVPIGLETSDGPPRLSKGGAGSKESPPATAPGTTPSSQGGEGGKGSGRTAPDSNAPPAPGNSKPGDSRTGDAKPGDAPKPAEPKSSDSKSTDSKSGGGSGASVAKGPESDSGAGGERPRLRRGVPVGPLPDDDVPGYSKPGEKHASTATAKDDTQRTPSPVQLIPAISDTTGPEPRSYAYEWLKDEEPDRLKQMTELAKAQLRAYIDAQSKAKIGTPVQGAQSLHRKAASKSPEPVLENVKLTPYDLWTNGQPVLVLSADAHVPPPGVTQGVAGTDLQYSIMLVARPDMYNNLAKLYVGITDKYHLDMTPRLNLIDVVDADGDGRGELLFQETSDSGSGYVIYRVTADKLWKMFDSLNPE